MLLQGCVSYVSVKKATATADGIRYFLPETFIQVTPATDGSVTVETVLLPDPANEYAVEAHSFLGKYTIDVNRSAKGFLETVNFNSDSTGIGKQLLQTAGSLRAAEIEAKAGKAKTDAADAKAAAEKTATALSAADTALKEAEVNLQIAEARRQVLIERSTEPNPPQDIAAQILSARLAVSDATLKRDAAAAARNAAASNAAMNAAAGNTSGSGTLKAPEPVFFKVEMTPRSVKLVQAFAQSNDNKNWVVMQRDRDTWKVPDADVTVKGIVVLPAQQVVHRNKVTGAQRATVRADRELIDATFDEITQSPRSVSRTPIISLRADKRTVDIELPPEYPAGDYKVRAIFKPTVKSADDSNTKEFLIRLEK